ncbi:circadian clock-controlled protein daywake [Euwallacea similis]|uniref:circadian clock-controlled protein daywake n=1 Tax=Euwallacea similis TaxID=1736056 RepID=UPI00344B3EB2
MFKSYSYLVIFAAFCGCVKPENPFYYIKQCHIYDENVNRCIRDSTNYLIVNMRNGIPELGLEDPEPVVIDQIQLAIGSGPDGYRAIFRDIEAYGVSNCTVTAVRSDIETNQFQFTIYIPKITARAKYESSGILILVRASGGGNYWGEYEGVKVKSYIKADKEIGEDGLTYLRLQQIKMDFNVKDIKMGVDGIHNGNSVLQAALNLFINSNAQELLKEMKPHLKKKFLLLMSDFITNVFNNVPYDAFLTEE